MKLIMKDGEGHGMTLRIPYGLILNKIVLRKAPKFLQRYGVDITQEQAACLLVGLRRFKKDYKGLQLLEMKSADGVHFTIIV